MMIIKNKLTEPGELAEIHLLEKSVIVRKRNGESIFFVKFLKEEELSGSGKVLLPEILQGNEWED